MPPKICYKCKEKTTDYFIIYQQDEEENDLDEIAYILCTYHYFN